MSDLYPLFYPALAALILLALTGIAAWSRRPRPSAALLRNLAARLGGAVVSPEIHGNYQGAPWRLLPQPRDGWRLEMGGLSEGLCLEVRAGNSRTADIVEQTGDPEFDRCFHVSGPSRLRMAALSGAARSRLLALRAARPCIRDGALSLDLPGVPQDIGVNRLEECHHLLRMCSLPADLSGADTESRLYGQLSDPHPAVRRLAIEALEGPLPPLLVDRLLQDDDPDLKLAVLARSPDLEHAQSVAIWRSVLSSRRQRDPGQTLQRLLQTPPEVLARTLDPAACRDMPAPALQAMLLRATPALAPSPDLDGCLSACLTRSEADILRQAIFLCTRHGGPALLTPLHAVQRAHTVSLHPDIARAAAVARAQITARYGGSGGLSLAEGGGLSLAEGGGLSLLSQTASGEVDALDGSSHDVIRKC